MESSVTDVRQDRDLVIFNPDACVCITYKKKCFDFLATWSISKFLRRSAAEVDGMSTADNMQVKRSNTESACLIARQCIMSITLWFFLFCPNINIVVFFGMYTSRHALHLAIIRIPWTPRSRHASRSCSIGVAIVFWSALPCPEIVNIHYLQRTDDVLVYLQSRHESVCIV